MDGRTLFDHNQVSFIPDPPPTGASYPCVFLSLDDLAIQNNQFVATMANSKGYILTHTLALGVFTLRVIGNRFSEIPGTALLSHFGFGLWNIVNLNQATHCVLALGPFPMAGATNQVIVNPTGCQDAQQGLARLLG
jgi:hypothetical protein